MPPPPTRHGTQSCYFRGCRRFECRIARAQAARERAERAQEGPLMVDAWIVRRHLETLEREFGIGTWMVMKAAGVAQRTVQEILAGRRRQVRATTADRLLAVSAGDATFVPSGPTLQRIAWLRSQGLTMGRIAALIGRRRDSQDQYRLQVRPELRVRRDTAESIERLYTDWHHLVLRQPTPEEADRLAEEERSQALIRAATQRRAHRAKTRERQETAA